MILRNLIFRLLLLLLPTSTHTLLLQAKAYGSTLRPQKTCELAALQYMLKFHNSTAQQVHQYYMTEDRHLSKVMLNPSAVVEMEAATNLKTSDWYTKIGLYFILSKPIEIKPEIFRISIVVYYPTGEEHDPYRWDMRTLTLEPFGNDWKIITEEKQSGSLS